MALNKQMCAAAAVAQVRDGMIIGIGGWGPRRKPMALIRELLRSPVKDLTVVAYGGADVADYDAGPTQFARFGAGA